MHADRLASSLLYDLAGAVAALARSRDNEWFSDHPRATWRVRTILEGECLFADGMRARNPHARAFAIVIDHARAGDRRATAGRVVYPVVTLRADRAEAKLLLAAEGERWARWFRKHATTPPASRRMVTLTGRAP